MVGKQVIDIKVKLLFLGANDRRHPLLLTSTTQLWHPSSLSNTHIHVFARTANPELRVYASLTSSHHTVRATAAPPQYVYPSNAETILQQYRHQEQHQQQFSETNSQVGFILRRQRWWWRGMTWHKHEKLDEGGGAFGKEKLMRLGKVCYYTSAGAGAGAASAMPSLSSSIDPCLRLSTTSSQCFA